MAISERLLLAQRQLNTNALVENVVRLQWRILLVAVALAFIAYKFLNALYNITLHPLSHIPGPRLAAATYLVEFYYDVILGGRYTKRIAQMHKRYGPIVRISPDELHCNDIDFADEIYAGGSRKRDRTAFSMRGSAMNGSTFAAVPHEHHRIRRSSIANFFSRAQVYRLESDVHRVIQRLCDELLALGGGAGREGDGDGNEKKKSRPLLISDAYSCFTSDIISEYCFGRSWDFLSRPGFEPNFRRPFAAVLGTTCLYRFFPFLEAVPRLLPWLGNYLYGDLAILIKTRVYDIPELVRAVIAGGGNNNSSSSSPVSKVSAAPPEERRETIFGTVLTSEELPPEEKTLARVTDEAISLLGAGTETVAWALTVITYHLLTKPHLLTRLRRELLCDGAVQDPENLPPWTTLEKLPYLSAVIHEGLRLSYGVSTRTARVARDEDLVYRGKSWMKKGKGDGEEEVEVEYVIPKGFGVGMSPGVTHHHEDIFPDSHAFVPERWLEGGYDDDAKGEMKEGVRYRRELERALLSFSKGSRACLGINLAYCELNLALTALALRVLPRMSLFQTTQEDVRYDYDNVAPSPVKGSKGVRVTMS